MGNLRLFWLNLQLGVDGGWVGLSHEYKVCKCPDAHIHKKLQPQNIPIPIALFRPRQNIKRHPIDEFSSVIDPTVTNMNP